MMNEAKQIKALEVLINNLLESDPGFFLVEIRILPGNNIKVFIDADQGAAIDRMVRYNRSLYKQIDEMGLFPGGNFSLEVSSPGLDEPLKLHRQYLKNIGRYVEVTKNDGIKVEGKLLEVLEKEITLVEDKNGAHPKQKDRKKTEPVQLVIPLENIKTTKIQIKF